MHRAPLGPLAMDGGSLNDHQSMTQLLQSCNALHAVADTSPTQQNANMRKINHNNNDISDVMMNDENIGPDSTTATTKGSTGSALQNVTSKVDIADLSQLAAIRKNRAPTMSRRNERERNRVRYLNFTFDILRQHLPGKGGKGKAKKMSKVDTLRGAIDYIHDLQLLLDQEGGVDTSGLSHRTSNISNGSQSSTTSPGECDGSFGQGRMMTESESDSLSPTGSPHYSGDSPGGGGATEHLSDQEEELSLASWFC